MYANIVQMPMIEKFNGVNGIHPIIFIKSMKEYFSTVNIAPGKKLNVAKQMIVGNARDWLDTIEDEINNFEELEIRMLERFWNMEMRAKFRREVRNIRWREESGKTLRAHAEEILKKLKLCGAGDETQETILDIAEQFPTYIQNLIRAGEVTSIQQLMGRLGNIQIYRNEQREKRNFDNEHGPRGANARERGGDRESYDRRERDEQWRSGARESGRREWGNGRGSGNDRVWGNAGANRSWRREDENRQGRNDGRGQWPTN